MALSDYDDLDFDDPRFLVDAAAAAPPQAELSYAERRKRKLIASEDKGRAKSRRSTEDDKRDEGLSTNLIQRAEDDGADTPALRIMKSMGYKPGEALGRRPESSEPSSSSGPGAARGAAGGIGFARASFAPVGASLGSASAEGSPAPAPGLGSTARTEPIRFEMRTGRSGLGVPQPKRLRPYLTTPSSASASSSSTAHAQDATPLPDLDAYLAHLRSTMDERRAHGLLRALRRTCEELDRRAGMGDGDAGSFMWRDRGEDEREQERGRRRRLFDRLDAEVDSDDDDDEEEARRNREREGGVVGRGELAYESGTSRTVVDPDGADGGAGPAAARAGRSVEDVEEEEEWFAMDVRTRLALMLTYLRNKYHYCFWCGCQYNSEEDLKENCPGTEEDQH
ncbi:hypothetical protein Rhopal_003486-T1 [Rhodotorula paludigena]|uniref:DUF4187 domain-containing protein n=1 Tax=Rhodotorula paludigena TaxID=86838 RepID=A0AAV5GKU3_9BASI|nr:hypothetical protein Rhopal_003486-T1 [Rhodotorula paludigena]